MKVFLTLLFLFSTIKYSFAQDDYGLNNNDESIKKLKVKSLAIYFFKKEADSILTTINTYDSFGGRLSCKGFSSDGSLLSSDTFIYDTNHYLVKQVRYSGNKISYESTFTNNENGKMLKQIMTGDSLYYEVLCSYDKNGRITSSVGYDNKKDTTVISYTYNKKGLVKKHTIVDNKKDSTVIFTSYNSSGKVIKRKKIYPESRYFSKLKYNGNGENYEVTTTIISDKPTTVNKVTYSYYPNGLAYQRIFYKNKKPIITESSYYTYY